MLATSILPHLTTAISFVCAGTLTYFGKRLPAAERRSGQDRRKRSPAIPNQRLSDIVETPDDVVNRLQVIHAMQLTWVDVDVSYCTDQELRDCMIRVLAHARADELSDKEMDKFWEIKAEMDRREFHPPLSGANA